jgi:hypothetical protein
MTLALSHGRDAASPLDVVAFGGSTHLLYERRVALCDRRVPAGTVRDTVEGNVTCVGCGRAQGVLERRQEADRRRPAARLRIVH